MATATAEALVIRPQPGPQERFLSTPADIAIFGGAAGGGKTFSLLMEPLRHVGVSGFGAVMFRRTFAQITQQGGMWDESMGLYANVPKATPQVGRLLWRFPSGAKVSFAHMQYEQDKLNYQGAQIALIGFDQLEHFSESQFFYMLSRNRSTCGVRPYVRATCNPDADSWLATLLAWWIDQDTGLPIPERAGVLRWFVRHNGAILWADTPDELRQKVKDAEPKSLTFIGAKVADNAILMAKDPGYVANLQALPPVERARLLDGNWKVRPAAGKVFNRAWVLNVPAAPVDGIDCRCWDFAATAKKQAGDDPDFTAGVKIRKGADSLGYVLDSVAEQLGPADGDRLLVNTCVQDAQTAKRQNCRYRVRWEEEPGSAGIKESRRLVGLLTEAFKQHGLPLDAEGKKSVGDKLTRGTTLVSNAQVGNLRLVDGAWNESWLSHMHGFPDLPHDDIWDATVGAYNDLFAGDPKPVGSMSSYTR